MALSVAESWAATAVRRSSWMASAGRGSMTNMATSSGGDEEEDEVEVEEEDEEEGGGLSWASTTRART